MINLHTGNSQPLTKLMILQQAVTVISGLEHEVRGGFFLELRHGNGERWFACLVVVRERRMSACACIVLLFVALQSARPRYQRCLQ